MFWDIYELMLDDSQTKKVKDLRRKSNYYESKYNNLDTYATALDRMISNAVDTYGLRSRSFVSIPGNVLEYKYDDVKSDIYTSSGGIVEAAKTYRDIVKSKRDKAYLLYSQYYNSAIMEDY